METEWEKKASSQINWDVPPSGGSLEIGNLPNRNWFGVGIQDKCSPFGGIPRNWKPFPPHVRWHGLTCSLVPPSGGSLEIGNLSREPKHPKPFKSRSPFGGIPRNWKHLTPLLSYPHPQHVPPSGGSLEIGNTGCSPRFAVMSLQKFPLRGDP